jgi:hypothetical protein
VRVDDDNLQFDADNERTAVLRINRDTCIARNRGFDSSQAGTALSHPSDVNERSG